MDVLVTKPFGKRFVLALLLVAALAFQFWTQSRYPALNEKAMMSGAIQLEDALSFEAYLPVLPEFPVWKKILYSTINWIKTNKQGMTFGVLFAAAILTLLGYLRRHSFRGGFSNSFLGLAIGTPLGVCVNCAAPIAKGLYSGGLRAETTLSAMIASPTLNIVVLTMAFSIMPFYMAVAKLGLSLFVILLAVPVLCRFLPKRELQIEGSEQPRLTTLPSPAPAAAVGREGPAQAVLRFAWDFGLNLWFIIKTTVPLMLLAGFLGAVVTTLLPGDLLKDMPFGVVMLTLTALVGTFLPAPIGLDVVAAGALLNAGLQPGYAMALLFTLGTFSVYSYFVIAGAISVRASSLLAAVIVVLGIVGGIGADVYHRWQTQRALRILTGFEFNLIGSAQAAEAEPFRLVREGEHGISVHRQPFRPRSAAGEKPFTRIEAWHLGIDKPLEFSFADMWPPFWEGRSIAAGDFDGDGNVDLVLASTERGLYFYKNDGAGRFKAVEMPIGRVKDMPVFNAVLVDIDNDGWLDLFIATYQKGNFVIRNVSGVFDIANMTPVKNRDDAILTMAVSFGDVNRDGYLDLALGNWAAGWYRRIPGEEARNRIVFNEGGKLSGEKFADLSGLPGETLSILFTDINMDGKLDLLEANDFEQPDNFYLGDGAGGFKQVKHQDNIVPMTTTTTMAVKTADLHNAGGKPDIYLAQIAGRSSGVSKTLKMRSLTHYCDGVERPADLAACRKNMATKRWYKAGNNFDPTYAHKCLEFDGRYKAECKGMLVKDLAIQNDDPSICKLIPADQLRAKQYCEIHFRKIRRPSAHELAESIPQILRRNVLLVAKGDGSYEERAVEQGLEIGGWSWDVKIADVDNDGWQDVYVVNGTWVPNEVSPSNLFFRNTGKRAFKEMSGPFGLEDYLITAAAVAVDLDNDGDLDFLTVPVNGPVMAFVNNSQNGNAIAIELRDHIGNRFGVGGKVEIRYGEKGELKQMREIQVGGGFMSFDAPVAHFGLGTHEKVESVTVSWADGTTTVVQGGLTAGARYRIERKKDVAR